MRGLNVYCCPSCGHYGFFQLVANAVCPHCSIAMTPLPIPYQDFMELDYPQRQVLISRHMLNAALPADDSKPALAPFASPPEILSHADSQSKSAPGKRTSSGKTSTGRSKSMNKVRSIDKTGTPGETKLIDRNDLPDKKHPSSQAESLSKGKPASPDKEKTTDVPELLTENNASNQTASADMTASAFFKDDSDISEHSDKETLYREVLALREKNAQLEQTISWMHDLIWELTRRLHITQNT